MLSSIHPFGERSRNSRWWLTTAAHVVGSTAGGATLGLIAGALGWLAVRWLDASGRLAILGAAALMALLIERRVLPLRLPSWQRQVNENWIDAYRGWVYGSGFGYQLGLGVVTIITTATVHLLIVACVLSASPGAGLLIGATFGLVRGALLLSGGRIHSPAELRTFMTRLAATSRRAEVLAEGAMAVTVGAAVAGVVLL